MDDHATLRGMLPTGQSKINLKIEVTAEINVSAFVARQKSNRFLITQAGDQLCAGDPELVVGPKVSWRVPVQYAPSRRGLLGIVGHLMVDADNGAGVSVCFHFPSNRQHAARWSCSVK